MSILEDAQNIIDNTSKPTSQAVYQEFRILVQIIPNDNDSVSVRNLLDDATKHFEDYIYSDETGFLKVVQVNPQ